MKKLFIYSLFPVLLSQANANNDPALSFDNVQSGFIENKGQVKDQYGNANDDIQFIYSCKLLNLELKKQGFSYELFRITKTPGKYPEFSGDQNGDGESANETTIISSRVDVILKGASSSCNIQGGKESDATYNYFLNSLPSAGITNVKSYYEVVYANIYPGIDMIFKVSEDDAEDIKYEFIVHAGADPKQIRLEYRGATKMQIDNNGNLEIINQLGEIRETDMNCYILDSKKSISGKLVLKGNTLSFDIQDVKDQTILIDPSLVWGAYYGGEADEQINSEIALDKLGKIVITGTTESLTSIATAGAYQQTFAGTEDVCVAKFNLEGKLIWGTYFGGPSDDNASGIATDKQNYIYITGKTASTTGISTAGSYQPANGGGFDGFLTKFSPSGALQWSTYLGGEEDEEMKNVACDIKGNVCIDGLTHSFNGISTTGAYQHNYGGGGDMVVAKFTSAGAIKWSTYYGGTGSDRAQGIAIDLQCNVIVSGSVDSETGISTANGFQTVYGGGISDAAFAKFDSSGNIVWGTYYGGESDDHGRTPITDSSGNIYVEGFARSTTQIATPGSFQPNWYPGYALNGLPLNDGFIVKFNAQGHRSWGTYYGGEGNDELYSIALDSKSNLYICGGTRSQLAVSTPDAFQPALNGGAQDGILIRMDTAGHRTWASYFGGSDQDQMNDVVTDPSGYVYFVMYTISPYLPVTPWTTQTQLKGGSDLSVHKFYPGPGCYDYNEPNETMNKAVLISSVTYKNVYGYSACIASSTDQDWFKVKVKTSEPNLKIQLLYPSLDYDLRVYTPAGVLVKESHNTGLSNETVVVNNPVETKYFINVVHDATEFDSLNCYRLLAIRKSTPWRASDITPEEEFQTQMMISPNPASGPLQLTFNSEEAGKNSVTVYDLLQHVVKTEDFTVEEGTNTLKIDLGNVASGIYLVELKKGTEVVRRKVVIEN